MKKSEIKKLVREELQGYSPQIGKTKGLTPDTLNKILKKIASGDDYEPEGEIEEAKKDNVNIYIPILDRVSNQLAKIDSEKYKKAIDHISDAIFELLGETKDSASRLEKVKNQFIGDVKFQLKRLKIGDELEEDVYEKILNKLPEYTDQLYRDYSDDPEYAAQYMAELFN